MTPVAFKNALFIAGVAAVAVAVLTLRVVTWRGEFARAARAGNSERNMVDSFSRQWKDLEEQFRSARRVFSPPSQKSIQPKEIQDLKKIILETSPAPVQP